MEKITFTKKAENVKDVSCSNYHSVYVSNNNDLYGCGNNTHGQQGIGVTENVLTFTKIKLPKE